MSKIAANKEREGKIMYLRPLKRHEIKRYVHNLYTTNTPLRTCPRYLNCLLTRKVAVYLKARSNTNLSRVILSKRFTERYQLYIARNSKHLLPGWVHKLVEKQDDYRENSDISPSADTRFPWSLPRCMCHPRQKGFSSAPRLSENPDYKMRTACSFSSGLYYQSRTMVNTRF